jgi:hypothetical protein
MLRVVHDVWTHGWSVPEDAISTPYESFLMTHDSLVLRSPHRGVSLRSEPHDTLHAKARAASRIPLMMNLIGNSTDAS